MGHGISDREAYQKIVGAFRGRRQGATVADIVAQTALPLRTVRELVPRAADEYSARLEATESGEIRYSFPRGFTSRYHGFRAGLRKGIEAFKKGAGIVGSAVFKVWIMGMLLGYFVLFMLIALAALMLSMAGSAGSNDRSSRRDSGGGLYLASGIFNMIIRIWFYSELTRSLDNRYYGTRAPVRPKGKPLYKAIFSFVFGDGDPNADWTSREKQGVIAYVQANRGVISQPEFMTLTGLTAAEAEDRITAYCVEFGGMPEATEDGTVVYRFDELLLRSDPKNRSFPGFSAPLKRLLAFSSNPKKLNRWFSVINGVNLIFGGYFLWNGLSIGHILSQAQFEAGPYMYGVAYVLLSRFIGNPLPFIILGLGIIPLVFSFLFWLIPGLRYLGTKKRNETIKLENLRKHGYRRIWETPQAVKAEDINPQAAECRPRNMDAAQDRVIKEMGAYAVPDVALNERGETVYAFTELEREKRALETYRASVDPRSSSLGKTVFDSDGPV
jgi:hypothetical protein